MLTHLYHRLRPISFKTALKRAGVLTIRVCVILIALLYFGQDKLILFPMTLDPDTGTTTFGGAQAWQEHGHYRGLVFEPKGAAKGTVLFFHGNAGTAQDRTLIGRRIAEHGYRAVLVEYPGFGARTGDATARALLAVAQEDTTLARTHWDGKLYIMGESFGAGVAAQVVKNHAEAVSGIVLFTPWQSLASLVDDKFFQLPVSLLLHERLDSREALATYRGPVVIVGAERDTLIPVVHARALAHAVKGSQYIELPRVGHNDWSDAMVNSGWVRVLGMMDR